MNIYGRTTAVLLLALWISCGGCSGSNTLTDLTGSWGAEHIGIVVGENGAKLEYDCAHGTIDEPLIADENGEFEAIGVHVREHGGPIRLGEIPDEHPARYKGYIKGNVMTLTVTLTDSGQKVGAFSLTRGIPPRVHKCL
ncbi:MAG: hypothetical protein O7D34_12335 [Ignavibacteria bacterium]|nr:hypothetical protein [Ignavibacteria bacterium]